MVNLKTRYLLSILTIMFLMTMSYAGAQDTTMVGIANGDVWVFKVVENSVTDEYGDIDEFAISSSAGGEVAVGDTFEFEVTADVSSTGTYDYTLDNGEITAVGTGNLGDFGSEAVFTDWDYWEDSVEEDDDFDDTVVTVTNGADEFNVKSVFETNIILFFSFTIEYTYYKESGVLKTLIFEYVLDTVTEKLIIENQTGAAAEVPGFGFFMALLALVAVPIISKKRK